MARICVIRLGYNGLPNGNMFDMMRICHGKRYPILNNTIQALIVVCRDLIVTDTQFLWLIPSRNSWSDSVFALTIQFQQLSTLSRVIVTRNAYCHPLRNFSFLDLLSYGKLIPVYGNFPSAIYDEFGVWERLLLITG